MAILNAFQMLMVASGAGSVIRLLETRREPCGNAPWRPNCIAGEKSAEVDYVENVIQILPVDRKAHVHAIRFIKVRARRSIHLKRRINPLPRKIDPVNDLLPVSLYFLRNALRYRNRRIAFEIKWQPAIKLHSARYPETRRHLIAQPSANRISLILRIWKMPVCRYALRIITKKQSARYRIPSLPQRVRITYEA